MIHLNDEQMIREPNLGRPEGIGMLQDRELDLVVEGFLGLAIEHAVNAALGLGRVPGRDNQTYNSPGAQGPGCDPHYCG